MFIKGQMSNFGETTQKDIDTTLSDSTIHIKVDSDHIQKDVDLFTYMFEQMVSETYQNAIVTKNYNNYGLLTDIRIKFTHPNDAIHFKLCNNFN